jgi:hypothetical protein
MMPPNGADRKRDVADQLVSSSNIYIPRLEAKKVHIPRLHSYLVVSFVLLAMPAYEKNICEPEMVRSRPHPSPITRFKPTSVLKIPLTG